ASGGSMRRTIPVIVVDAAMDGFPPRVSLSRGARSDIEAVVGNRVVMATSLLRSLFVPANIFNAEEEKEVKLQDVSPEDYPTPQKYLEGAPIPSWYSFQSNLVGDMDLKPGMARMLEVDKRLTLPTRTHIRFLITGADVIHSWSVPSLGIKCDATPGRLVKINTFIQREGVFYGQCSELCGTLHAFMPIVVEAVSPEAFAAHAKKWYKDYPKIALRRTLCLAFMSVLCVAEYVNGREGKWGTPRRGYSATIQYPISMLSSRLRNSLLRAFPRRPCFNQRFFVTAESGFKGLLANDDILFPRVHVIGRDGGAIGVMDLEEAKAQAREANLDLVLVNANKQPPVCRIAQRSDLEAQIVDKLKQKEILKEKQQTDLYSFDPSLKIKYMRYNCRIALPDFQRYILHHRELLLKKHRTEAVIMKGKAEEEEMRQMVVRIIAELKDIAKPVNLPLPAQSFEQPSVNVLIWPCTPEQAATFKIPKVAFAASDEMWNQQRAKEEAQRDPRNRRARQDPKMKDGKSARQRWIEQQERDAMGSIASAASPRVVFDNGSSTECSHKEVCNASIGESTQQAVRQRYPLGHAYFGESWGGEVPLVEELSSYEFWRRIQPEGVPVKVRVPELLSLPWTLEYLSERYGSEAIRTEVRSEDRLSDYCDREGVTSCSDDIMSKSTSGMSTVAEAIGNMKEGGDVYIISQVPGNLAADLPVPSFIAGGYRDPLEGDNRSTLLTELGLWVSFNRPPSFTSSVIHYDMNDQLMCQILGWREWIFWDMRRDRHKIPLWSGHYHSPSEVVGSDDSPIEGEMVDVERWPEFASARWFNTTLRPGECIFIPKHHALHYVRGFGEENVAYSLLFDTHGGEESLLMGVRSAVLPLDDFEVLWPFPGDPLEGSYGEVTMGMPDWKVSLALPVVTMAVEATSEVAFTPRQLATITREFLRRRVGPAPTVLADIAALVGKYEARLEAERWSAEEMLTDLAPFWRDVIRLLEHDDQSS
ncbi:hypothetical protein FOZ63_015204, partial [Perkinsus olseni]